MALLLLLSVFLLTPCTTAFCARHSTTRSSWTRMYDAPKLALLTFDLDDTLFPCQKVVDCADAKMLEAMRNETRESEPKMSISLSSVYNNIRRARKRRMGTYSELRTLAIQRVLNDEDAAARVFGVWFRERQDAVERHLFPGVLEALRQIKEEHPHVCIGAITNGRADPMAMHQTLAPYFSFCVSGEDPDVFPDRKPHAHIYETALKKANTVKGIWCHVGDDLAKDVQASAKCGAFTIWAQIHEMKQYQQDGTIPRYSTASAEERERLSQIAKEGRSSVNEKLESFQHLPAALHYILECAAKTAVHKK